MINYKGIMISKEEFSDYGYLVDEKTVNKPIADNSNFTYWDKIAEFELGPVTSAGIVVGHNNDGNVKTIERHKNTPEVLVGLKGGSIVLLAYADNGAEDVSELKAFKIKQGQAVILYPGTWHSAPIPTEESCKLLVLFNTDTPNIDLEEIELDDFYVDVNKF